MFHWLLVFIGVTDPSGLPYLTWSGIVGDVTIFAAIWMHFNCHDHSCWKIALFRHQGIYRYCRKHHPEIGKEQV